MRTKQSRKAWCRFGFLPVPGVCLLLLFLTSVTERLQAHVAVFLEEPYGNYGHMVPMGHVALYLDRICAASPTELRRCQPGETGIVLSRYRKIAGRDWYAIPLIPYLYAVESSNDVPFFADAKTVAQLRDTYRRSHLREFVPDAPGGEAPEGQWIEMIGSAYDRRLYAFELETSDDQDDRFIEYFNSRANKGHFNSLFNNCADFAREVVNFYYPKAVRRSITADLGMTTPKQIAKAFVRYSRKHPDLKFSAYTIEQIPGSRPPSRRTRGVAEALVKSKKYAVPIILVDPWIPPMLLTSYIGGGRFNPSHYAETVYAPAELERRAILAAMPYPPVTQPGVSGSALAMQKTTRGDQPR